MERAKHSDGRKSTEERTSPALHCTNDFTISDRVDVKLLKPSVLADRHTRSLWSATASPGVR